MKDISIVARRILLLSAVIVVVSFLAYQIELALPAAPSIHATFTPLTKPAPQAIGSYDILGHVVDPAEAKDLLQTDEGRQNLSPENGAIAVTQELIALGRKTFYEETFGNEIFQTDGGGSTEWPD